jgi:hypothetical protein
MYALRRISKYKTRKVSISTNRLMTLFLIRNTSLDTPSNLLVSSVSGYNSSNTNPTSGKETIDQM